MPATTTTGSADGLSADWSNVPVAVPYATLANPQTLNLYSMVSDDTETSADLDGHCGPDGDDAACDSFGGTAFSGALSHPIDFLKGVLKQASNNVPVEDASPKDENMQWKPSNAMQSQGMQAEPVIVDMAVGVMMMMGEPVAPSMSPIAEVEGSAREAADAAQAGGRTSGTAAALRTSDGTMYTAESGSAGANHPAVQQALDNVPASQRSPYHGCCAEIKNLNQAKNAGKDVQAARAAAAKIRKPGNVSHGGVKPACPTCQHVNNQLGVTQ